MSASNVKNDIKNANFKKWYIFAGDEWYVQKIYIDMIAKKTGYDVQYVDTFIDVYSRLRQKSFLSKHTIYVVFDDKDFQKDDKQWAAMKNIKDDIVILKYSNIDSRLKFWKNFKDRAAIFEKLDSKILKKHIKKEIDLSDKNCERLMDICEYDLGRIMNEIDKIKRYADFNVTLIKNIYNNAFEMLLSDNTIYIPPKDAIFDFVASMLDRNAELAYRLLEDCRGVGEANMVIISNLYNNFRNLLQVQSCNGRDISKSTGLNGFYIKLVKPYINRYSEEELVDILHILRKAEKGIKTGEIPESISVDWCMVNIL